MTVVVHLCTKVASMATKWCTVINPDENVDDDGGSADLDKDGFHKLGGGVSG